VEELGPWIVCVLRGNHKAHRANKAIKELWFAFCLTCQFFYNCGRSFAGSLTIAFILKLFSFSDREKVLRDALDRHC